MTGESPIGIGVVGLGFMGCTHIRAYQRVAADGASPVACRLVAVADRSAERLNGRAFVPTGNIATGAAEQLFDPGQVRCYLDPRQLLDDPGVQVVSICTHTDTHVDLAVAALNAGKHVLVEKPVALASADVSRLAAAAAASGRLCMPAMCMRFWPGWSWLRETIRAGTHGAVLSATFQRLGSTPTWTDFYRDRSRSGGALVDLHIHDADFIRWCFGEPREVVSTGSEAHVTTIYRFDGPSAPQHVVAEGGHDYAPGTPFRMRYMVAFERATADFDLTRTAGPPLLLHAAGNSTPIEPDPGSPADGYEGEVRHFLRAVRDGTPPASLAATMDDAVQTARLLEAEQRSLRTRSAERVE